MRRFCPSEPADRRRSGQRRGGLSAPFPALVWSSGVRWTGSCRLAVTLAGEHPDHPEREPGRFPQEIHLEHSWQEAAVVAAGVAVAAVALRASRRPRLTSASVFAQDTALVLGLFALWQYAGSFSVMGPGGALGRGRWLWHAER